MSGGTPPSAAAVRVPGFRSPVLAYRGRQARVFKAVNERTGAPVALKVMHDAGGYDEIARLRDLGGARGVVPLLDVARAQTGEPVLVMPFQPDGSYADILARSGPVDLPEAVRAGRAVAGALAALHGGGLLHNDVVPGNVLRSGTSAVLTDFGWAAALGAAPPRLRTSSELVFHAPPEVLRGRAPVPASDVYSLASTLWTVIAGRVPFADWDGRSPDPREYARTALREAAPDLPLPGVPRQVNALLVGAMAKDPAERPATPAEFEEELGRLWSVVGTAYGSVTPAGGSASGAAQQPRPLWRGAEASAPAPAERPAAPRPEPSEGRSAADAWSTAEPSAGPGAVPSAQSSRPVRQDGESAAPSGGQVPMDPRSGGDAPAPSAPVGQPGLPGSEPSAGPSGGRTATDPGSGGEAPAASAPMERPTAESADGPGAVPPAQPSGPVRRDAESAAPSGGQAPVDPRSGEVPATDASVPEPSAKAADESAPAPSADHAPSGEVPEAPPSPVPSITPASAEHRGPAVVDLGLTAEFRRRGPSRPPRKVGRRPKSKPVPGMEDGGADGAGQVEAPHASGAPAAPLDQARVLYTQQAWQRLEGWTGGPDTPRLPGTGDGRADRDTDAPGRGAPDGPVAPDGPARPRWRRHLHIGAAAASVVVLACLLGAGSMARPGPGVTAAGAQTTDSAAGSSESGRPEEDRKKPDENKGKDDGGKKGGGEPRAPEPPGGVALKDGLTSVEVTWKDASGGTARYFVVGGVIDAPPSTLARTGPGVQSAQVDTASETAEYCFTVVAVDGRSSAADEVCTDRAGARAQAQAEAERERQEEEEAAQEEEEKEESSSESDSDSGSEEPETQWHEGSPPRPTADSSG